MTSEITYLLAVLDTFARQVKEVEKVHANASDSFPQHTQLTYVIYGAL